jgi:hypothetical protein
VTEHRHPRCVAPAYIHPHLDELPAPVIARLVQQQCERLVTIADEAFGPMPAEPLEATIDRISRGISNLRIEHARVLTDLRRRIAELEQGMKERTDG